MGDRVELELTTKGAEQQHRDVRRAAKDVKEVGKATERSGKKAEESAGKTRKLGGAMKGLDSVVKNSLASVKSWILGFAGLSGVIALVNALIQRLEKIREIQNTIAAESLGLQEVAIKVAGQLKITHLGQAGLDTATALLTQIMKLAGLKSPEAARGLIIGADVALPGEDFFRDKLPTLKAVAPIVGAKQLSADDAAALFALLSMAGLTGSERDIKASTAKLLAAYGASPAVSEGAFIKGAQVGAPGYLGAGGAFGDFLVRFTQARKVTATEPLAATLIDQLTRVLTKPSPALEAGLQRAAGGRFRQLGIEERIAMLEQLVGQITSPEERDALVEALAIETAPKMISMLAPENLAATAGLRGLLPGVGAKEFEAEVKGYKKTFPYIDAKRVAERAGRRAKAPMAFWLRDLRERTKDIVAEMQGAEGGDLVPWWVYAEAAGPGTVEDQYAKQMAIEALAEAETALRAQGQEGAARRLGIMRHRVRGDVFGINVASERAYALAQMILAGEEVTLPPAGLLGRGARPIVVQLIEQLGGHQVNWRNRDLTKAEDVRRVPGE